MRTSLASRAHTPARRQRGGGGVFNTTKKRGNEIKIKKESLLPLSVLLGVFTNQHRGPDSQGAQLRRGLEQFN